jgi:tRNA U34 5-methylaminomethyl-2-thiouridine-forming methyltransferase MnmC
MESPDYRIVKLAGGAYSVRSLAYDETFHPVIGPVAEAEALYVRQLNLPDRLRQHRGEFVVWDIGLGAAANPITLLLSLAADQERITIVSFDQTAEPLQFALAHREQLSYLNGFETECGQLLQTGSVNFKCARAEVHWTLHLGDFPTVVNERAAEQLPKPHVILFDAYSPAKNPAMWTQPLFARIFQLLDPKRACAMPTYSRSTMLRVSLLLAGFHVGAGHATGEKEETTIAANNPELIAAPLDRVWLERARNSTSAEPLWEPIYRQLPLSPATLASLEQHPQFAPR